MHREFNPRYHRLIEKFAEATGVPLVLKNIVDRLSIDPAHPHAKSGKWTFVTGYLSSVKAVEVIDPQTVQLHLKYPTGSLPALLALPNCAIVTESHSALPA